MRERPILFSAPMVRAILAGTKTQTRRVMRDQSAARDAEGGFELWTGFMGWQPAEAVIAEPGLSTNREVVCPYGQPGDRLWVREAFRLVKTLPGGADGDAVSPSTVLDSTRRFEADGAVSHPDARMRVFGKLRPGIHMPRWASRITLEITDVRVERLQAISEADALAEGCEARPAKKWWQGYKVFDGDPYWHHTQHQGDEPPPWMVEPKPDRPQGGEPATEAFRKLWFAISGAESWDANPWVWCITFRRVEA